MNSTSISFSVKYNNPTVKLYKKISTYKETFVNKMKKVKKTPSKKVSMMSTNPLTNPSNQPNK